MTATEARDDRARGTLVGLAAGDALGAPVEFSPPEAIAGKRDQLFQLPGGGPFGWDPGEFTDDTQMALMLARHLAGHGGEIEEQRLALDFAAWAADSATEDVGDQTRAVLARVRRGASWREAIGGLPPDREGNGSLMRVAPVALVTTSADVAAELARRQSCVTHPNRLSVDACAVFASALVDALDGRHTELPSLAARATEPEIREAILGAANDCPPKMSGYVVDTLASALWAVHGADDYSDAVWRAVSLGRDADTVGAVAGALAGAMFGYDAIPRSLSEGLTSKHPRFSGTYPDELLAIAEQLTGLRGSG